MNVSFYSVLVLPILCCCGCNEAQGASLYHVEDATIESNKLICVVGCTKNVYEQSFADKLFGSRGRLVGKTKMFVRFESIQDISINAVFSFGDSSHFLQLDGNESATLSFTRQSGLISYRMPKRNDVGLIHDGDRAVVSLKSPAGTSHVACGSIDGSLLWQNGSDLFFYDIINQIHVRIGTTPLASKGNEWCDPMYPSCMNAFYDGKTIYQWKDGANTLQKYDLASGAVLGGVPMPEGSSVCAIIPVDSQVFYVVSTKCGSVSILDESGEVLGSFKVEGELSATSHHFFIVPESNLLVVVERDIHPHNKVVRVWLGDWIKADSFTREIKLPVSL
ncbi:MAG: hypothetical protein PHT98_02590 [Kiritimatiellae bacterium]|nr:hypothetical protein [Kiritimatiellia bacterium]